jgi:hypothetical protein
MSWHRFPAPPFPLLRKIAVIYVRESYVIMKPSVFRGPAPRLDGPLVGVSADMDDGGVRRQHGVVFLAPPCRYRDVS